MVDQKAVAITQRDCTLRLGSGAPYQGDRLHGFGEFPKEEVLGVWLPLQFPIFLIAELSHKGQWDRFNPGFPDLRTADNIWGFTLLCRGGVLCIVGYRAALRVSHLLEARSTL